jgi:hypothetical protein
MARLLFIFTPGGIDEFFPQIGQTPPEKWRDLSVSIDFEENRTFNIYPW